MQKINETLKKIHSIACLFILYSSVLPAADLNNARTTHSFDSGLTPQLATEYRLEVNNAELNQVLATISGKTGIPIHFSMLSQAHVTATCIGSNLKLILSCLLGPQVDLVYRYPEAGAADHNATKPVEIWLVGSSLNPHFIAGNESCNPLKVKATLAFDEHAQTMAKNEKTAEEATERLMAALSKAGNPADRAQIIAALAVEGQQDNKEIRTVLLDALNDRDSGIKAQALFGWHYREGENALPEIYQALQDEAPDVRMMALNLIDDKTLLRQALNDADESVKAVAAMRLETLAQKTNLEDGTRL